MPVLLVRGCLAAVLIVAALLKLGSPRAGRRALATFGLRSERLQWAAFGTLVTAELGLAAGVLAGSAAAAYAAAALQAAFAAALAAALAAGRSGAPCGCFGARSRVRASGVARNVALAAALALLPSLPASHPSADDWLALGLAVALLAVAALIVAVLALAREVGELRLALGPQPALEIAEEGPELGGRTDLIGRFSRAPDTRLALAVFTSEGCPVCASLAPAVEHLGRDPIVSVHAFDEHRDADAWRALRVPGAPFAVALGLDGTVLAKGTAGNLPQLESVLGSAERRAPELAHA